MGTGFSVIKHVMVPDHQIMTAEEIEELLAAFKITSDQLPNIYHDDPAVKEIGAKINDVIRIVRNSKTAGKAEAYRIVVKRPKK